MAVLGKMCSSDHFAVEGGMGADEVAVSPVPPLK